MAPNGSQKYPAKTSQKCTTVIIKSHKNTPFFRRLFFICSHDILTSLAVFETQKKQRGTCSSQLWELFQVGSPQVTSHCRQKSFHRFNESSSGDLKWHIRTNRVWPKNVNQVLNYSLHLKNKYEERMKHVKDGKKLPKRTSKVGCKRMHMSHSVLESISLEKIYPTWLWAENEA